MSLPTKKGVEPFIADIFKQLNAGRRQRFKEEAALLRDLPQRRLEHFTRRQARVSNTSTITVQRNTYSVQRRLIGEKVEVRVYLERLEVWYGQRKRETMPRPSGRGHHHVQYRHVIDWLVRKPGAFPRYRYRDAFFPTHIFRMTYDRLRRDRRTERAADQAYLRILHLAALNGEVHVEAALPSLLKDNKPINQEAVVSCMETPVRSPTTLIAVERTKLGRYNDLVPGLAAGDGASVAVTLTAHLDAMGITPLGDHSMKTFTAAQLRRQLLAALKELRLPTMRALHREQADLACKESLSYEHYLLSLLERELEERHANRIHRWLRESRLPLQKTMDAFDRSRLPPRLNHHVSVLLEGGFLDRHENVLAFGPPGCGKTHLLCALGIALIHQGRRVLFRPCSLLVQDLLAAKRTLTLDRLMKRLRKYDALILDDIGYVQHSREEMEVLFTLLAQRYERGSVMLTSNVAFSDWERIFKDPMTTAAAIDRLVHHCVILEMNLPSYRLEAAKNRLAEAADS